MAPPPDGWGDKVLNAAVFGQEPVGTREPERPLPDFAALHEQRQKSKHVTRQLLWEEYREANPDDYRYRRFCELYRRWLGTCDVVLRQEHKAGEKAFTTYEIPVVAQRKCPHNCSATLSPPGTGTLSPNPWDSTRIVCMGGSVRAESYIRHSGTG